MDEDAGLESAFLIPRGCMYRYMCGLPPRCRRMPQFSTIPSAPWASNSRKRDQEACLNCSNSTGEPKCVSWDIIRGLRGVQEKGRGGLIDRHTAIRGAEREMKDIIHRMRQIPSILTSLLLELWASCRTFHSCYVLRWNLVKEWNYKTPCNVI